MKLTMLLCDAAEAVNGKLYVLGAGWNSVGPEPSPSAIALQIDVPWDEANRRHQLKLVLLTDDGRPVTVSTPLGDQAVEMGADFEVGRPAGHRVGAPLSVVLAVSIAPLPLASESRFEWRCYIDGATRDDWVVGFSTRSIDK